MRTVGPVVYDLCGYEISIPAGSQRNVYMLSVRCFKVAFEQVNYTTQE